MRDAKLDRIDLNILAQLQRDRRPSNVERAKRAGRRIESARRSEARCISQRSMRMACCHSR